MLNGIISVSVIFIMCGIGFIFSLKKMWPEASAVAMSVVTVKLAAPSLAIVNISEQFTPELIRESFKYLLILGVYFATTFLLGKLTAKAIKLRSGKKVIFELNFLFSNTIFIGLPINEIVFGKEGLSYLFIYYITTLTLFWSYGAYSIAKAGADRNGQEKESPFKRVLSPGLVGVTIGCLIVEFQVDIPFVLKECLSYLARMCVPLSLLVIGANLSVFAKGIKGVSIDEIIIILAKFIISPLIMFGVLKLFNVEGLVAQVFILTSAMPCHMQASILAQYNNVESEYSAKLVGLTTLICMVTVPITVYIVTL